MDYDRILRLWSSIIDDVFHDNVDRATELELQTALALMLGESNVMTNMIYDDNEQKFIELNCRVRFASTGKWKSYVIWKDGDIE